MNYIAVACISGMIGAIVMLLALPIIPFILWALEFIDMEGHPMRPRWWERLFGKQK